MTRTASEREIWPSEQYAGKSRSPEGIANYMARRRAYERALHALRKRHSHEFKRLYEVEKNKP